MITLDGRKIICSDIKPPIVVGEFNDSFVSSEVCNLVSLCQFGEKVLNLINSSSNANDLSNMNPKQVAFFLENLDRLVFERKLNLIDLKKKEGE